MKVTPGGQPCDICHERNMEHDSFHLMHQGNPVHIDVDIAELIYHCWAVGIDTTESCQGFDVTPDGETEVFISFADVADYVLFAHSLLLGGPRDRFSRDVQDNWDWSCHPVEWDSTLDRPVVVPDMFCSVVFPLRDVSEAIHRLMRGAPMATRPAGDT